MFALHLMTIGMITAKFVIISMENFQDQMGEHGATVS